MVPAPILPKAWSGRIGCQITFLSVDVWTLEVGTPDSRNWLVTQAISRLGDSNYHSSRGAYLISLELRNLGSISRTIFVQRHSDSSIKCRRSPTPNFCATKRCEKVRGRANLPYFTIEKSTPGEAHTGQVNRDNRELIITRSL